MVVDEAQQDTYTVFAKEAEPRLRRALCAAFGRDVGLEATAEALAYGWEHWDKVSAMDNPIGYLYKVGRSRVRAQWRWNHRRRPLFDPVDPGRLPRVEPGLPDALSRLSERQRVVVALVHGMGCTHAEAAETLGLSLSSIQTHLERGMRSLRDALGVSA